MFARLTRHGLATVIELAALALSAATLVFIIAAMVAPVLAEVVNKQIRIESGVIAGAVSGDVVSFRGIPYAAPPVGLLRWRAPQAAPSWSGVRPATAFGSDCMQKPIPGDAAASGGEFAEDCLFVNVWRPATTRGVARLPVLMWIHGGGFLNGGSSAPMFDGSTLARQGLVVVSLNYRLGRLGFFMHPALTASGQTDGNFAFLDQLAALRWVRRNIAAFGGDARQVTIAGESAGGISVVKLLTWPAAEGLFQRAIVMSGGGRNFLTPLTAGAAVPVKQGEQAGLAFARSMHVEGIGAGALAALRALSAEQVNGDLSMVAILTRPDTYAGGPILDGKTVTGLPGEALRKGTVAKVPVLIGTTGDDLATLFPPREDPLSFFGADAEDAKAVYFTDGADPATAIKKIGADLTMHEPARFVARQMTAWQQPAWLYRFEYVAQSRRPEGTAEHAKELPYLFGTLDVAYGAATTAKDRAMADMFMGYFAAFARTGNPNRSGLRPWRRYDAAKSELMVFTPDAEAIMQTDPWKSRLDLVERAVERQATPPDAWEQIGYRQADVANGRDTVQVKGSNRYKHIRLCVEQRPLRMRDLNVVFANGGRQDVKVRQLIRAGTCTPAIDLGGDRRDIREIIMRYDRLDPGKPAIVKVYAR